LRENVPANTPILAQKPLSHAQNTQNGQVKVGTEKELLFRSMPFKLYKRPHSPQDALDKFSEQKNYYLLRWPDSIRRKLQISQQNLSFLYSNFYKMSIMDQTLIICKKIEENQW